MNYIEMIILSLAGLGVVATLISMVRIVPTQRVLLIERLGKYHKTLEAGFNIIAPFIDRVVYKHSLKEIAIDVAPQSCITKDNITVDIDGVLYYKIVDPIKASYGIDDYHFSIIQLAQTTMRSEIGSLQLDVTFESRDSINNTIVRAVDEASDPWGIKVTRYEIKNIETPQTIRDAMEKEMRAVREKREKIALSEGDKLASINRAEGQKQEAIKISEGKLIKLENEARGQATAIREVAEATAAGIKVIAQAINQPGGQEAVNLRIATDWIKSFESLAKNTNSMIVPTNVSDLASVTSILKGSYDFSKNHPLAPKKGEDED